MKWMAQLTNKAKTAAWVPEGGKVHQISFSQTSEDVGCMVAKEMDNVFI